MSKPQRPVITLRPATTPAPTPQPEPPAPAVAEKYRLVAPFGFVDEIDAVYFKPEGAIITNPLEIAVLKERGAQLEAV